MMIQASAPGKVLILGGYVIVEEENVGISVGVNARFTTRLIESKPLSDAVSQKTVQVHLHSPQFHQSYSFEAVREGGEVKVLQTAGNPSVFIKFAVLYTVAACAQDALNCELTLELLADNDFYSQRNYLTSVNRAVTVKHLRELPPCLPLVGEVSKTGLGSSAAMTTSLVCCLYRALHGPSCDVNYLHSIAQIAHSVAQQKIGSGFDVYTAVYGTCTYRRFSPEGVSSMLKGGEQPDNADLALFQNSVTTITASVHNTTFRLPEGLKLMLGDIHHGGSSTPGMVVKIMTWKKSVASQADNLWEQLKASNARYVSALQSLLQSATSAPERYQKAMSTLQSVVLSNHTAAGTEEEAVLHAHKCALESRQLLRQVGEAAGVPVEPTELTGLLNDTAAMPGVFATGCPGAGGYDAVFALVIGEETAAAVEAFWESKQVCPLLVREDPHGVMIEGE